MEIETIIKQALAEMYNDQKNEHLLKHNVSERCLVEVFKKYFEDQFITSYPNAIDYDINLEYNLHNTDEKYIRILIDEATEREILPLLSKKQKTKLQEHNILDKLIYPDLIVHKIGHDDDNLVVIEFKKVCSATDATRNFDKFKLEKMLNDPFNYKKAFYVEFSTGIGYNQLNNKIEEVTNRSTN